MPDNTNNQSNNQSDNQNQQQQNNNSGIGATSGKKIVVGIDTGTDDGGVTDGQYRDAVANGLKGCGNEVVTTQVGPNQETYMQGHGADMAVFLCNGVAPATMWSFVNAIKAGSVPYTIFALEGWYGSDPNGTLASMENVRAVAFEPEHDAGQFMDASSIAQMQADANGAKTIGEWADMNSQYFSLCYAKTPEEMAQNICSGTCGGGGSSGSTVGSGGGAQIKDKTFEKCIRRICAATDSVFLVENNAAVLFPYTDWMAFTLRQKINTIKSDEIDPNIFSIEYGNDGFYNKVSIAWGGATLPERFETKTFKEDNEDENKTARKKRNEKISTSYTVQDILNNMKLTNFKYDSKGNQGASTTTKKDKTTQTVSISGDGTTMLSEQYDVLVEKYGEMEKRVESAAPDFETAQYIVNALLIQYIRDFNNSCKVRALNVRKYIGGTFYAVENPFDKTSELYYLNSYTIRTQKDAPLYHDLEFKYGPESAEEILDYQTLSGGAASGGTASTSSGSASEEAIWKDAAKCKWAQDQPDCSTNDPNTAKKHYDDYTAKGEEVHFDCYGMSAYLYGRFNNEAKIPCQVVGDSSHKVVMLNRGNGFVSTADDYRKYNLDYLFKWRNNQNTTVLLPAPGSNGSTSGGNTNSSNTNSGNGGSN